MSPLNVEYSLCGLAFDCHAIEADADEIKPTKKQIVTCAKCIDVIEECKGVRYRK